jgi:hypothetical protein
LHGLTHGNVSRMQIMKLNRRTRALVGAFAAAMLMSGAICAKGAEPALSGMSAENGSPSDQLIEPVAAGPVGGVESGSQLAEMIKEMINAREQLLKQERELQRTISSTAEQAREKLRNQLREDREELLARQRELRQEFKYALAQLKEQLMEHRQLLEQVRTKENVRSRRGD